MQRTASGVVAWFPKDSLSAARMQGITDTLALGIQGVKDYIKAPLPWQKLKPGQPIAFYFSPGYFVSHASQEGVTFVPYWRAKANVMPWLHEANHELLAPVKVTEKNAEISQEEYPQWLNEGAAEFIALQVSADNKLPKFDLFKSGTIQQIDKTCLRLLRSDKAGYILSYIGSPGIIPELSPSGTQRILYAPAFYNCSCSFNKYLVSSYGISSLLAVIGAYPAEQKKLAAITGVSPDVLRSRWLNKINVTAETGGKKYIPQDSLDNLLKTASINAGKVPASAWFRQTMKREGLEKTIQQFNSLRENKSAKYKFLESYLNDIGYELLDANKIKDAIAVFGLNAEMYPASANVFDSWAEAYMKDKQLELARKYYVKSLELNPRNDNARVVLKTLAQ
ncbi:MAG TPA: tetratricopeptide repeat protein [Hymenobacter sp.]